MTAIAKLLFRMREVAGSICTDSITVPICTVQAALRATALKIVGSYGQFLDLPSLTQLSATGYGRLLLLLLLLLKRSAVQG